MAAGEGGNRGGKILNQQEVLQKCVLLRKLLGHSVTCAAFVGIKNRTF
jgi:hypothetical protein